LLNADTDIFMRFEGERPGRSLIAVEDAALPVTMVRATVLAQERKSTPLLEEFVLRLVRLGILNESDLAAALGLDRNAVEVAVAEQIRWGNIGFSNRPRGLALTRIGEMIAIDLESVVPVQKEVHVAFDRMTWNVANYRRSDMLSARDIRESGMYMLPALRKSHISLIDITPQSLSGLIPSREERAPFEVLAVQKVVPSVHLYLPVRLLIYGDSVRRETDLAVCIDSGLSESHEQQLEVLGGASSLGISIRPPADPPQLDPALQDLKLSIDYVQDLRTTVARRATVSSSRTERDTQVVAARDKLANSKVRALASEEHPDVLAHAIEKAKNRLMIISPSITSAVVDWSFVNWLDNRLRAGVTVHIGYGNDAVGHVAGKAAIDRLMSLVDRFKNRLTFARFTDIVDNVLIYDDTWIPSSFNWLSYRGNHDLPYRREEGVIVRDPAIVGREYESWIESFAE
jgi:hypothetical protein